MRLAPGFSLLVILGSAPTQADDAGVALVATRIVEPARHDVTLPRKLGVLQAAERRTLAFEVAGRLEGIAEEGQRVAAGEVIAELDSALERARLRQAELQLAESHSERKRLRGLRQSAAASAKAVEAAETAAGLRAAELEVARQQLGRRTLRARFDGVVGERVGEPGELVTPSVPVATLLDLETLKLEIGVPGYQVGDVSVGARVLVRVPALGDRLLDGTVHRVAPAAAERSHLFEVEVRIPNPPTPDHAIGEMRPGMSAWAEVVTREVHDALVIPLEVVVPRGDEWVVFFVAEGRARAVPVSEDRIHGESLLLPAALGLRELIVRGQHDLSEGVPVVVDNSVLAGAKP